MPTEAQIKHWKWRAEYFRDIAKHYTEEAAQNALAAKEYRDRAIEIERRLSDITTPPRTDNG